MKRSVFIVGPQGCGKTTHAEQLRAHFGLDRVIDGWTSTDSWPTHGALILTHEEPRAVTDDSMQVYRFSDAMDLANAAATIDAEHRIAVEPVRFAPLGPDATAVGILLGASEATADRAAARDCPDGERSMARCVRAFNAITGHDLTEVEGWHFMELLKLARATAGGHQLDDHVDRAAYAGLAGEAAAREARAA